MAKKAKAKSKAATKRAAKSKIKAKKAAPKRKAAQAKAKKAAKKRVQPIPAGYNHVTPYLISHDAAAAIKFYTAVFGAKEKMRMPGPDGRIGHAEMRIGGSMIMLADEAPQWGALAPRTVGGSPVTIMVYVKDVDAVVAKATATGAKVKRPVQTQFYGDRSGSIEDPDGHTWHVSTHVEDVPAKELARRAAEMAKQAETPKPAEAA